MPRKPQQQSAFKHALVQPIKKQKNWSRLQGFFSNFVPISKVLEKTVYKDLSHLNGYHMMDTFQSGFRGFHSTESAHLRIFNYVLLATDSGFSVLLLLLDLFSAFDNVDHILYDILNSRLEQLAGLLAWP